MFVASTSNDSELQHRELSDLWDNECDNGGWSLYEIAAASDSELPWRGVLTDRDEPAPALVAADRRR